MPHRVTPLPGGSLRDIGLAIADARREFDEGLPTDTIPHLIAAYGSRYRDVMEIAGSRREWKTRLAPDSPVIGAELVLAARKEMAPTLADIVIRRTPLGALGHPGEDALQTRRRDRRRRARLGCRPPATRDRRGGRLLRQRERVEDVGEAGGEADRRIDRRHAEEHAGVEPHRAVRVAAADLQDAAALGSGNASVRVEARPFSSPTSSAACVTARANDRP